MSPLQSQRVLSGMRPTGQLHLGHYHGVLKNWAQLQHEYQCFFFVADWHALTTEYENPQGIVASVWDMVIDWLSVGVNPSIATLFIQSKIPEHAELHLLLSMLTPLSWLERVPTYKDQQEKLKEKDLATYGFLGYPLLQSADILIYKAAGVPVGEDQVPHVEITREVARRFNHLYGYETDYQALVEAAIKKMGKKNARVYLDLRRCFQEQGDTESIKKGHSFLDSQENLTLGDRERLFSYLEGVGKVILPEPQALLTSAARMPGLDGQKMSKSYGNTIALRESPEQVEHKIRTMPTDPARVRRSDPGDPDKCPVWQFHLIYSDNEIKQWVQEGCRGAGIGCLDCKRPIIDRVQAELKIIRERAQAYIEDPNLVQQIINEGNEAARKVARKTLEEVREVMGLSYG
ncbi:tryptophanyl-tRNA synthetase [Candidatus Nitrosoglobus terrae]|uniref:Tryptophan--tRNA ligase n=1 Tax=Candidatus Nitrosoglobus terrae TaxID=1630141 RepID=A0A1Q2SK42_9GAMM|nr:tryptophan--tRNA ligase [Candidatus Nitrosoglobus terrae]BAW79487.1 tryptophanyl-tRNA synthetase [Candidatus Nitrosoglobus terrae]